MKPLFYKFGKNIFDCFRGYNLIFQLLAILITYILVVSGFDWKYFSFFSVTGLPAILFSAAILGSLIPIIIPITVLMFGKIQKNFLLLNTGFALGQAVIIGYLISSFYKIFSGRIAPPLNHISDKIFDITPLSHLSSSLLDRSKTFYFGFFRNGIFWGWPSSHTTIAFAMTFTLWMLFPKNKVIKILALFYALYIGLGVSMTIHWFSDFVAGAIIGTVIGIIAGKAFNERKFIYK